MATSLDWRQLYYPTNCQRWYAKSIAELRPDASAGHVVAKYVLAQKLRRENAPANSEQTDKLEAEVFQAGLPQALIEKVDHLASSGQIGGINTAIERMDLLNKAVAAGYPPAKMYLASLLLSGKPIKPDPERAVELMRAAYDESVPAAGRLLGLLFATGVGEPRSEKEKPEALLREAAEQGDIDALQALAHRFRVGFQSERNLLRAAKIVFCTTAVGSGNELQWKKLYERDPDAPVFNKLLDLFSAGLLKSDSAALTTLADMHAKGENGAINLPRAAAIYELAARAGDTTAPEKHRALREKFNPAERAVYDQELNWMRELRQRAQE